MWYRLKPVASNAYSSRMDVNVAADAAPAPPGPFVSIMGLQLGPAFRYSTEYPRPASEQTALRPLQLGLTVGATWSPSGYTNVPRLEFNGCQSTMGAYNVHEVAYDNAGQMVQLAVDFSTACGTGALRFHSSVPLALDSLYAVAGRDRPVVEGSRVTLDGSVSWSPTSRIRSMKWKQISGPAFDLSACANGVCQTYAPLVPAGGAVASFQLHVESETGAQSDATLNLEVRSLKDRQSLMRFYEDYEGPIRDGADVWFSAGAAFFPRRTATGSIYDAQGPSRLELWYYANTDDFHQAANLETVTFSSGQGVPLAPGTYSGTTLGGYEDGPNPTLDVSFEGQGCSLPEWDVVFAAVDRDPADLTQINQLALSYSMLCREGESQGIFSVPTHVTYWVNYQPVQPPQAAASGPSRVSAGSTFVLRDGGSTSPRGYIRRTSWHRIFGPPAISEVIETDKTLTVVTDPNTPDGAKLVYAYQVDDDRGQPSVAVVEVVVRGGPAPVALQP